MELLPGSKIRQNALLQTGPRLDRRIPRQRRIKFAVALGILVLHVVTPHFRST
jgi:hypothetical protein